MAFPKKVADRISASLRKYQTIIGNAKSRDVSESDTVVIIADILQELLGYDKYSEVTTEFAIRNTFVDLAVKVGNDIRFLIEAKAVGVELKDSHIRQAVDYAVNQGVEWVILTNAQTWKVFKIHFRQPVEKTLVFDIDLMEQTPKNPQLLDCFGNLSREGFTTSSMAAVFQQQQAISKFSIAAIFQSETVIMIARRELRRAFPGLKVDEDFVLNVLRNELLKRDVVDSEEAKQAAAVIRRAYRAIEKERAKKETASSNANTDEMETSETITASQSVE